MAQVLAMPKGRSQLSHSHSCLRQFPLCGWGQISSWEAKGESRGWAACRSGVVSGAALPGMMLLCAEDLMAWPARWSWQRSSSRDSRQPQRLITSSQGAGDPGPQRVSVVLSLLLIRQSEQVSACYSHIPVLSYKHYQTKLCKCTAATYKRRMRLQTQVIWCENICCNKWELFIFEINFCKLFAKFLCARYLYIFDINSRQLINETYIKKKKKRGGECLFI